MDIHGPRWGAPHLGPWISFSYFLFLHVNSGPSQNIVVEIRGDFSFGLGYLGPWETFAPPPPNFKIVPGPLHSGSASQFRANLFVELFLLVKTYSRRLN